MTEDELLLLLHDWRVVAEYDAGYTLGRCGICGFEDLLDTAAPLSSRSCVPT